MENPLKMMKNILYFMLKTLFVLGIFTFFSYVFVIQKNSLIRKLMLIAEFMASQIGQQIITRHILLNISISKDNQAMRFGQLIEYNLRNIFL